MNSLQTILFSLIEEGTAAKAHFQVWWALRNLALPDYYETMNQSQYVDFFHASNSGHYKLFYIALSKIYDRDEKSTGIRLLKERLTEYGYNDLSQYVDKELSPNTATVARIKKIRNQSIAHSQSNISRAEIYDQNEITPNQIRELIEKTCMVINIVAQKLDESNCIFESNRLEKATLEMLSALERGRT